MIAGPWSRLRISAGFLMSRMYDWYCSYEYAATAAPAPIAPKSRIASTTNGHLGKPRRRCCSVSCRRRRMRRTCNTECIALLSAAVAPFPLRHPLQDKEVRQAEDAQRAAFGRIQHPPQRVRQPGVARGDVIEPRINAGLRYHP